MWPWASIMPEPCRTSDDLTALTTVAPKPDEEYSAPLTSEKIAVGDVPWWWVNQTFATAAGTPCTGTAEDIIEVPEPCHICNGPELSAANKIQSSGDVYASLALHAPSAPLTLTVLACHEPAGCSANRSRFPSEVTAVTAVCWVHSMLAVARPLTSEVTGSAVAGHSPSCSRLTCTMPWLVA